MMRRAAIAALLIAIATAGPRGQDRLAHPSADLKGLLYRAVFLGEKVPPPSPGAAAIPRELASRVERFLGKHSTLTSGSGGRPEKADVLKLAIVTLLDRDDAAALAEAFLKDAPMAGEWGETPEAPLREAAYAEKRLTPSDPLAPFLYVFIAQRQRAAFEAAERVKDLDTMKAAARKYRAVLQRARAAADPIFALLADDLDRMPHVWLKTTLHPATFNPDT
jgi:hypothetical protein